MGIKKTDNLWISKEKFKNITKIENKLEYSKWLDFIENEPYYTWEKDTENGKFNLSMVDSLPTEIRDKYLKAYDKISAEAEYNKKKGYYDIRIGFNKEIGVISINFQKKVTKEILEKLLDMAKFLDALLLKNGTIIIDEKFIDELDK